MRAETRGQQPDGESSAPFDSAFLTPFLPPLCHKPFGQFALKFIAGLVETGARPLSGVGNLRGLMNIGVSTMRDGGEGSELRIPLRVCLISDFRDMEGRSTSGAKRLPPPISTAWPPSSGANSGRVGGIAIWSDSANIARDAPRYIVQQPQSMRFVCAAILAPKIRTLPLRGEWRLHYRIAVQAESWAVEALEAAAARWSKR